MDLDDRVTYLELTPDEFRKRLAAAPIAYLPLGTLEWHGEHLPLGSDALQSQGFFRHLAREVGGIVLPPLFLGPDLHEEVEGKDYYGMDFYHRPGGGHRQLDGSAYWVSSDLFVAMLESILRLLARAGFRIVVGHGHGPSTRTFLERAPEWQDRFGLRLLTCWRTEETDWHAEDDGLGIQTDHAGANETSLMLALHPELVRMERLPEDPDEWPEAVLGKDPRAHASAEVGWQAIRLQGERMARLLRKELAGL